MNRPSRSDLNPMQVTRSGARLIRGRSAHTLEDVLRSSLHRTPGTRDVPSRRDLRLCPSRPAVQNQARLSDCNHRLRTASARRPPVRRRCLSFHALGAALQSRRGQFRMRSASTAASLISGSLVAASSVNERRIATLSVFERFGAVRRPELHPVAAAELLETRRVVAIPLAKRC